MENPDRFPPELVAAHERLQEAVDTYDKFLSVEPLPVHSDPPSWDVATREAHRAAATELDEAYEDLATVRRKLGLLPAVTERHDAHVHRS
jgi:hypothetical protein